MEDTKETYRISRFLTNTTSQIYMEETQDEFLYYISLAGANKEDIDIRLNIGEDFLTIFVELKKDTIFVNKNSYKIGFVLEDILYENDDDIKILFDRGVLEIKVNKKF